ncbi:coiled-coil domain-containing protein 172-like [Menidia menidia]
MSLNSLFEQILVTEQQQTEQTQKFKDVKVAIIRCNERIKSATEKYEKIKEELDKKARHLSALRIQHTLVQRQEEQMLKRIQELLDQKRLLGEHLNKLRRKSKDEEENFLQEISKFNSDFSLRGDRKRILENRTHSDLLVLEKEVESLKKDMEAMSSSSLHIRSVEEEKKVLLLDLRGLESTHTDLARQLAEAQSMTDSLKSESQFVSQKHLTDSTCMRLREELELLQEAELQRLREALCSEIQLLQSSLNGSQENR